ncbi:MAG: AAA family ATPase [Bacteroidales bacterium]|nr:AAA family ATPase [Bacteroidales bacterium]
MGVEHFFQERIERNFRFEPTDDQRKAAEALAEFVTLRDDSDIMVLTGYAGTGKTSLIAAFVEALKSLQYKFVLLAPTGRSAKVLSGFTGEKAYTMHKHIYRQQSLAAGGKFNLDINKASDTFYIVDEASLITIDNGGTSIFGSGDLLDDFVRYVRMGRGNNMVFVGDRGQLPPIGMEESPALDIDFLQSCYGTVVKASLSQVVRQAGESGILYNATLIRRQIEQGTGAVVPMELEGFDDIESINGGDLIEKLSDSIDHFGLDEVVVLCRSNKRANRYNAGIRSAVLYREEQLNRGDKLMVVKNCYQFLEDVDDPTFFIANGDVAQLMRISRHEERYGLHFAEAVLSFSDYNDLEITAKIILDTLSSESPALTAEQQNGLFEGVLADYSDIKSKKKRFEAVREDPYFNALQIKYASAVTCHKSQGGQWKCVFIDNPFWRDDIELEDLKWLYTAITRATGKVYLINFKKNFIKL